ncbi:Lsa36 family surface (lipo)protein [Spirochaeta thermophila]|nr:hypothetical protein [Spirochaeta thermophila]
MILLAPILSGLEVQVEAPQVDFSRLEQELNAAYGEIFDLSSLETQMNADLASLAAALEADLRDRLVEADVEAELLLKGFSTAAVFASHAGGMRSSPDYSFIQVSVGGAFGFQNPSSFPFNVGSLYEAAEETFNVLAGGSIQLGAEVGFNLSFLVPGLHVGVRFGKFMLDDLALTKEVFLSYDLTLVGLSASYPLINGVGAGGIGWSGIHAGTGVLYEGLSTVYSRSFSSFYEASSQSYSPVYSGNYHLEIPAGPTLELIPWVDLKMTSSQVVVPLEILTGFSTPLFRMIGGGGVDLAFGSSRLEVSCGSSVKMDGTIEVWGPSQVEEVKSISSYASSSSAEVNGEVETSPLAVNPKLIMGAGWFLGPVVIDTGLVLYFNGGSGFSGTLSVGWVW